MALGTLNQKFSKTLPDFPNIILKNSISIYKVAEHNETRAQVLRENKKGPNAAKQKNLGFLRTFGGRENSNSLQEMVLKIWEQTEVCTVAPEGFSY